MNLYDLLDDYFVDSEDAVRTLMNNGSLKKDIYLWKTKNIPELQGNLQQNRYTAHGEFEVQF